MSVSHVVFREICHHLSGSQLDLTECQRRDCEIGIDDQTRDLIGVPAIGQPMSSVHVLCVKERSPGSQVIDHGIGPIFEVIKK